jgi:N-acetylneuraminic acid mutarotase
MKKNTSFIVFLFLGVLPLLLFTACTNETNDDIDKADPIYELKKQDITDNYENTNINFRAGKGKWTNLQSLPLATEGMSVANVGDKIIAALGYGSSEDQRKTYIYNIETDSWSMGADAPGASSEGAGVAHGGLFYNVGGRGAGLGALWSYDIITDSWTILSPMLTSRAGLGVAVVGNNIYAIGGRTVTGGPNDPGKLDIVEKYDIDTDTWSTVASLPSPRSDLAAVAHGGKIYVFGGFDANGIVMNDVDVYDPVTDTWDTAPADMPTARGALYAVGIKGDIIFVIGGWDGTLPFIGTAKNIVEGYKVSKDSWDDDYTSMPTSRGEAGVVSHGGRIYMIGGGQPAFGTPTASVQVFKP